MSESIKRLILGVLASLFILGGLFMASSGEAKADILINPYDTNNVFICDYYIDGYYYCVSNYGGYFRASPGFTFGG